MECEVNLILLVQMLKWHKSFQTLSKTKPPKPNFQFCQPFRRQLFHLAANHLNKVTEGQKVNPNRVFYLSKFLKKC